MVKTARVLLLSCLLLSLVACLAPEDKLLGEWKSEVKQVYRGFTPTGETYHQTLVFSRTTMDTGSFIWTYEVTEASGSIVVIEAKLVRPDNGEIRKHGVFKFRFKDRNTMKVDGGHSLAGWYARVP